MSPVGPPPRTAPKRPGLKQKLAVWMRWLHIYSSLFGLAVILFFSVTGLTLNHPEWMFGSVRNEQQISGEVPAVWVQKDREEVAKLEVVEHLRRQHGVRGFLEEFNQEETECMVVFKGPGYSADAYIQRDDGKYELTLITEGWVAVMNDLHKGRNTGHTWSWVIDVSALVLIIISVSGLILLLYIKRRRLPGLALGALGAALAIGIAMMFSQ
jgi:hypothetical protein